MRIAIDGRALTGRYTGDRTYWRALIGALARLDTGDEYLIYSRTPIPEGELPTLSQIKPRVVPAANDRLWTLLALPRALRADRADVLHVQYTTPPTWLLPCPVITTVHDISFRLYPEWFPRKHRVLLNLTVPGSMRRAARVITDSESSRTDILRTYRLPEAKVVATVLGLPDVFVAALETHSAAAREQAKQVVREKFGLAQPFVLAVGVLQPRKNLPTLAKAFGKAKARYRLPHQLVLVGKAGWGAAEAELAGLMEQGIRAEGGEKAPEALVFPGYVPDADVPALYRACDVFAHPALYEGFGLPPLEAMACGAPTLVSDAPAMPEVVGDAALIVPARDEEAWAQALGRLLTDADLRADYARRGPMRARQFSWETTARQTQQVYEEAVGKHG